MDKNSAYSCLPSYLDPVGFLNFEVISLAFNFLGTKEKIVTIEKHHEGASG